MSFLNFLLAAPARIAYEGTVESYPDAFIPELWANESLAILEENMVLGNLIHRDFEPVMASYGDVVNTRKPATMKARKKTSADSVTVQTPAATSIPVVLNQHIHSSFMVRDADQSKSFKDLVVEYLHPAMLSIAHSIDLTLSTQAYQFLGNGYGGLGQLSSTNAEQYIIGTRQVMNLNKAYAEGRNLVVGPVAESAFLQDKTFTQAYSVGDEGTALRDAALTRKFGFDIFMAQNTPYVSTSVDVVTGLAINHSGGYAAGTKTFTVNGLSSAISNGSWITIAGDYTPLQVVSSVGGATPTSITTAQAISNAVGATAAITILGNGAATVNQSGGYAQGWLKEIVFTGFTNLPQVGQAVTFGTTAGTPVYGVTDVDSVNLTITLDRPLEESAGIANGATINLLPSGSYNFAFHRNALTLVTRPLALPMPGTGARAGVANFNGMSMRVVMAYDANKQGTLVTVDTLCGVKVLDSALGAVLLG